MFSLVHTVCFRYHVSVFVAVFLFTLPFIAFGHGFGQSYEEVVDGYQVDIAYDPPTIASGESMRLDFAIYDEKSGVPIEFSDVWLRIEKEKRTVFASGIHRPEFGPIGVLYTFPEEGIYTVSVRFQRDEEALTEVTFPLEILKGEGSSFGNTLFLSLLSFFLGGLLAFLFVRNKA